MSPTVTGRDSDDENVRFPAAVAFAGTQTNFELNVYMPVIARNLLESIALLASAGRNQQSARRRPLARSPARRQRQPHQRRRSYRAGLVHADVRTIHCARGGLARARRAVPVGGNAARRGPGAGVAGGRGGDYELTSCAPCDSAKDL